MEDTQVRAPLKGTIIQKNVELGTVISSPTKDVGGGTVLLRMANLDTVQVSALVDETDVGKVQPGVPVTITVDAFPNRPFDGQVLKIEPQAQVNQNVTMFPVLVNILNPGHLLKPGMNTEVEIHIGQRQGVLAIPNAALRTQRDVASAAQVLGLDPEQALLAQLRSQFQRPEGAVRSRAFESNYIVFALRGGKPVPVAIRTGLTDQDYIEVADGLQEQDTVLVLPSASLVQSQQDMRRRFQNVTGGGLPGLRQQQPQSTTPR